MQYSVIAEKDSNSEHKKINGGWGGEDGLKSDMLICTTFGITFLSIQKWLNKDKTQDNFRIKSDNDKAHSDKICLHVASQNHSYCKTYCLQQSLYQMCLALDVKNYYSTRWKSLSKR